MLKVASLFSGCGGLDYGFEKNSFFEIVFANDFDHYACETYRKNFPKASSYLKEGDINLFINEIPQHDLLLGGFPCQSFSLAGKRKGFEDSRGLHYLTCKKVLKNKQPRFFIFENVGGLKSHDKGKTLETITSSFKEVGYNLCIKEFSLVDYGVPQRRKRILFFGAKYIDPSLLIPSPIVIDKESLKLKYILDRYPILDKAYPILDSINHNYHIGKRETKLHWIVLLQEGENLHNLSDEIYTREMVYNLEHKEIPKTLTGYRRLNGDEIAPTMFFGNTCLPIHPYQDRDLSVREVAAIQGFSDDFIFCGGISHQYKQLGNAVPPIFSIQIADHLAKVLS